MRFREEMRKSLNRSLIQDPDCLQDAQKLAELPNVKWKPTSFRVLSCVEFYDDSDQHSFQIVYQFPGSACQSDPDPFSIYDLINSSRLDISKRPSLGDIFKLAQNLTNC